MSSNWELAVSQARGEYVLVLGDDDALLFHALRELDRLVQKHAARAIRWSAVYYTWPDFALPGQQNYLRVPLGRAIHTVPARSAIARVIRFEACYTTLPMLYNAAIQRTLVDELRSRAGRVFGNGIPDVYSGFALAFLADNYISTDIPMHICGQSARSYGIANLFLRGESTLDQEFRSLNQQADFVAPPWVPDVAIFPEVPVADSFLAAKKALFPADEGLRLDRKLLATRCVHGIRARDAADWSASFMRIRDSMRDNEALLTWFDATHSGTRAKLGGPPQLRCPTRGYDGECLHLNADDFGVTDVYGAAELCEKVLGYRTAGISLASKLKPDANAGAEERLALIPMLDRQAKELTARPPGIRQLFALPIRAPLRRLFHLLHVIADHMPLPVRRAWQAIRTLRKKLGSLRAHGRPPN
jgi:hypothetical protein